jgi:hypothetical protein
MASFIASALLYATGRGERGRRIGITAMELAGLALVADGSCDPL